MILKGLRIQNFRSIKDTGEIPVQRLLALIGENNCGKSNILLAVERLVSGGAAGTTREDFNDPGNPITVKGTFGDLSPVEQRTWKTYLVKGELLLEKWLSLETDARSGKLKVQGEFHGYRAEPKDWFLSLDKIGDRCGNRPNWRSIVEENHLPAYFLQDGNCNKTIFSKALSRYLADEDVEYDEPDLSETHALGLESNVVATLPSVYFLRAITDYSDEIDKRTTSTTFRRLMGDLSERILRSDPGYAKIERALQSIKELLNGVTGEDANLRLQALTTIETRITSLLKKLMPSVQGISLAVEIDEIKEIFSRGIALSVDDGIDTDVLAKGHGLQRCIVFTLLQALIMNERGELAAADQEGDVSAPIILAIGSCQVE